MNLERTSPTDQSSIHTVARTACVACHDRKVKCDAHDGGIPCSHCRAGSPSMADNCRIHQKRKRQSRLRARTLPLHKELPTTQLNKPGALQASSLQSHQPESHSGSATTSSPSSRPEYVVPPPPDSTSRSVTSLAGAPLHPTEDGDYRRYLIEFIDQPHLTERPIDKEARMAYVGTEVSNTSFLVRQQFGHKTVGVSHYPTNRLSRRHTCHEPDRLPIEAFQLPSKSVVDRLLDAYFTHIHPTFPVVDQDLFLAQYQARDPHNPPSLLLLHAILVAGAHVLYDRTERDAQKVLFFRRAKTLLDARFERNRDTVVQAALLLTWHSDGAEDVVANSWYWVGFAARTAMGLGMHRDADKSTLVPHNKRMWRRVWWLLFQCDVLVSLQYGRPQAIRLEESDVKRLQASDFENCGTHVQVDYCLQQTNLCIIISRGMKGHFCLSRSLDPLARRERMQETDQELAGWLLQQHLSGPQSAVSGASSQLLFNTALVLFNRNQPVEDSNNGDPQKQQDDKNTCSSAAMEIQHIFQQLCERDQLRSLWVFSVNCLFTALIQLSVQVKTSNPVVAISALRRYESALSAMRQLAEYWPNAASILHFFESFVGPGLQDSQKLKGEDTSVKEGKRSDSRSAKGHCRLGGDKQEIDSNWLTGGGEVALAGAGTGHCEGPHLDIHQVLPHQQRGINPGHMSGNVDEILEAWQEWQRMPEPGPSDDFMFTF